MNNLFCIVSAIGNDYGVFSYRERFEQLLESVNSIKVHSPGDDICVIDASYRPLPKDDIKSLESQVNYVHELYDDHLVKWLGNPSEIAQRPHALERKSLGEVILVLSLTDLLENHISKKYNRVFKLTGRFKLTEDFNKVDYSQAKDKVAILKRELWSDEAHPLRLWSFDYSQLQDIKNLYQVILQHTLVNGRIVELVEKSMYKWTNDLNIPKLELEGPIGIEGRMGADGIQLYE